MDVSKALGAPAKRVSLDSPKVYHIPDWGDFLDPKRMEIIARIAKMRGRDPRIATKAVEIIKRAGVPPRDYVGQSKALLHFVQHDLYYVNEPGERLVDPLRTLQLGYGDCDDLVMCLAAFLESIRMPWKLVISGTTKSGKKVRYVQGEKFPKSKKIDWSHIYIAIGDRPFRPGKWYFAETTVRGAPLGWDVVDGSADQLPEMNNYGAAMPSYFGASMPTTYTPSAFAPSFTRPVASNFVFPATASAPSASYTPESLAAPYEAPAIRKVNRYHHQGSSTLHADMVAIVVRRADGRILALKRADSVSWMARRWDLPGGKTLGMPAKAAACKILEAEAGISVDPQSLRGCSSLYHPGVGTSMFFELRLPPGAAESASVAVSASEHADHAWVYPGQLLKEMAHVPYIGVALRACDRPGSLAVGFRGHPDQAAGSSGSSVVTGITSTPKFPLISSKQSVFDSPAFDLNTNTSTANSFPSVNTANLPANVLGAYGEDEIADLEEDSENLLMKRYYGIPVWAAIAAGGAAYLYRDKIPGLKKKRKNPRRRKNRRKARRNGRRR